MLERAEQTLDSLPVPRRVQVMVGAARAFSALDEPSRAERLAADR